MFHISVVCRNSGCCDAGIEWIVPAQVTQVEGERNEEVRITGRLAVAKQAQLRCPACGDERSIAREHALKVLLECPDCGERKTALGEVDADVDPDGRIVGGVIPMIREDGLCLVCETAEGTMEMDAAGHIDDTLVPDMYGGISAAEMNDLSPSDRCLVKQPLLVRLECPSPGCEHVIWAPGQWNLIQVASRLTITPAPAFITACPLCHHRGVTVKAHQVLSTEDDA